MNSIKSLSVWSNALFIIPAAMAWSSGLSLYAVLIFVSALVSFVHHSISWRLIKIVDQVLAISVIIANLFVLYVGGFAQPYFAMALLFVVLAFYFFLSSNERNYDIYHSLWHLCSVIITIMCILSYRNLSFLGV